MRFFKRVLSRIVSCFILFFSIEVAIASDFETGRGWSWGDEIAPEFMQCGGGTRVPHEMSELFKIPLKELTGEGDEVCQEAIADLWVPESVPINSLVTRKPNVVSFTLKETTAFASIYNHPVNAGKRVRLEGNSRVASSSELVTIPHYRGHGALFSVFRAISEEGPTREKRGMLLLGTAYLVSPHCILTAAHNVVLSKTIREDHMFEDFSPYAETVEFWPLMNGIIPTDGVLKDEGKVVIDIKLHPKWDSVGYKYLEYDIAALKLKDSIGFDYGCQGPQRTIPEAIVGKIMFVTGYRYGDDFADQILHTTDGKFLAALQDSRHKVYYEAPTKDGQSGGAIRLVEIETGFLHIGTHTTHSTPRGKDRGGVVFNGLYDIIGQWVTELEYGEGLASGVPSPMGSSIATRSVAVTDESNEKTDV